MSKFIIKSFRILFLVSIALFAVSCSSTKKTDNVKREVILFPSPPDTARIQFLTAINSSDDISVEPSGLKKFLSGSSKISSIHKPHGICAIKNKLFVVDYKVGEIAIIDFQKRTFTSINPTGLGNLKTPLNCFADTSGNLYVLDLGRGEIVVFDYDMNYKNCFGIKTFEKPTDVCSYKDKIYVSDMKKNKIFVFSKDDFKLINSFPNVSEKDTAFLHQPIHITIQNDKLYITDFGEFHIKVFDLDGKFLSTVGTYGEYPGQFSRPKGIAVDRSDILYAIDAQFNNVQIFNGSAEALMDFGGEKIGTGFLDMPIRIAIDYDNIDFFKEYVDSKYRLKYLIYVTNQFGNDKVNVYGFIELR